MNTRINTRPIKIGNITLGGNNHVFVQSMCNIKTSNYKEVSKQINRCETLGAELMRVSVLDEDDAKAIKKIKELINIPLIADIHFSYKLALLSIENGVDAVRINPGNIGKKEHIKLVVDACKKHKIPIRIGVNSGSMDKDIVDGKVRCEDLVNSAKKHVTILEEMDFFDIVISLKGSSVNETISAYKLAAETFIYPLHIGITEAGPSEIGIIRSVAGLAPLIDLGIGNTIRISLSNEPEEEIKTAVRLLHDFGLYPNYPTLISCPTCGRTMVDLKPLSTKVLKYLEDNKIYKTVAIMGCVVNGPGEAKNADIGLAGGNKVWVLFKKGQIIRTIKEEDAFEELIKEISRL